jgi:hypothetical protein
LAKPGGRTQAGLLELSPVDEALTGGVDSYWDTYFRHYTSSCGSSYDLRNH